MEEHTCSIKYSSCDLGDTTSKDTVAEYVCVATDGCNQQVAVLTRTVVVWCHRRGNGAMDKRGVKVW